MLNATKDLPLATTITGSIPRPAWFDRNLGERTFRQAMGDSRYREQYQDAVSSHIRDQERAGIDVVTDGDCHFDIDVGGQSWFLYPLRQLEGFSGADYPAQIGYGTGKGSIIFEAMESRVLPRVTGRIARGELQYAEIWKLAQERATRPVKFDGIASMNISSMCWDKHYKKSADMNADISKIVNREYKELVAAGCKKIQIDEPNVHFTAANPNSTKDQIEAEKGFFNSDVSGVNAEIWAHSCWGNPNQQHPEDMETISYEKAIPHMLDLKADVITFEMSSTGGRDLKFFKDYPTKKKIGIGVIDHVSCQVESPKQVAKLIRQAIKYIDPGQLVITSDCGFGREGFGRRIAYYKLRSMVEGARIVREEIEGKE